MTGLTPQNRAFAGAGARGPLVCDRSAGAIDRIIVINDFSIAEGGAGVLVQMAIRGYVERGFPVTLLTGQGSTPELQALGVDVVGLGSQPLLELPAFQALRQGYQNTAAERMVGSWIARNDTQGTVYHLHNWSQILSPAVYRALAPVARRTVVTCHDFFNVCPNGGLLHFGKSEPCELKPMSRKCITSQCDRRNGLHKVWRLLRHSHLLNLARFARSDFTFTFIHPMMRETFIERGFRGRNLVTITNPVEPWTAERIEAERNAGYLFVGRIGRDKGADCAVEAARKAGQRITLIGTGELAGELEALAETVTLAGWCDRDAVASHARKARALIVPSRVVEPFGLVILEAAMSGLPVIVSDRAFLSKDIETADMGRSFAVNDTDHLASILTELATADDKVAQMSHACRARAADYCHTVDGWIDALVEVLESRLT